MRITFHIIILLLTVQLLTTHTAAASTNNGTPHSPNDVFETLMEKIRTDFAQNPHIDNILHKYDDGKGCFTDIDYGRRDRTNWEPLIHINRLYDFAFAYTHPQNTYYQNEDIYNKIVKGLEYWYERNPHCNNWWYNQIAEPQKIGILLIQMRTGKKQLPPALETKTLQRIRKEGGHPAKWTGANRTDIALHWIYRSCLEKNETDLKTALENAYSPIEYTVKEGFQHDNSYFQHGVQLYIGGYGDEILKGITQVAIYTQGTPYALSDEKIQLLSKFMRGTYYQTIRGKHMLFDVLGRGISRKNITDKSATALFAQRMIVLDPKHADEYKAIIARLEGEQPADYKLQPLHTHYFRGDYTLHVRPGYTFDVRMVSNRTMRCEYGNGENLKTYFMSDGCTNIVTQGDEYAGIFPVWNWCRIPGTTAPQLDTIPMAPSDWQTKGTSVFAGGVSDSLYGVSVYDYTDNYAGINTQAKKAWFFFDNEIVCLGAGIHSSAQAPLYTTINQCLLNNTHILLSQRNRQSTIKEGEFFHDSPDWIWHNGIGYLFPQGGKIFLSNRQQSGSWYDINRTQPKEMQHRDVFTLGFDHGTNPRNNSYAYIIAPGITSPRQMETYNKKNPVEIIANTDTMQIVRHKKLGIWQMVFYREGTFSHKDITIQVDKPCALIIKNICRDHAEMHIADPAQKQSCIKVDICIPKVSKNIRSILCDFKHTALRAGASQKYLITRNKTN
ncbi:polysaccharide lyase 8 family protein [uncultured Bacteroides sp.]|uniref:polysaccharide lyase 8 family protein n=1 Tax=uncultured Bacteroides sp. TaxID=162156 RepID=UPI0025F2C621|nr:polysaccharide lyase 8 family protein [uncultured Bacteroides sp.]